MPTHLTARVASGPVSEPLAGPIDPLAPGFTAPPRHWSD